MRTFLTAFLFLLFIIACNNKKHAVVPSSKRGKTYVAGIKNPEVRYGIEGFYTGAFKALEFDANRNYTASNKITICIDSLDDENIFGHSIVAGNERPFSGTYNKEGSNYIATLKEPGDNQYDGEFNLTIMPATKKIKGTWTANDKKLTVTKREYLLEQKLYSYDPSLELDEDLLGGAYIQNSYEKESERSELVTADVALVNASKKLLTSREIENMYKGDLEVIRNAIYARHGYSFKNIRMRDLFDNYVPWYLPVSTNVSASLTEIELKNITLIKRYEAHATKYYDDFGR